MIPFILWFAWHLTNCLFVQAGRQTVLLGSCASHHCSNDDVSIIVNSGLYIHIVFIKDSHINFIWLWMCGGICIFIFDYSFKSYCYCYFKMASVTDGVWSQICFRLFFSVLTPYTWILNNVLFIYLPPRQNIWRSRTLLQRSEVIVLCTCLSVNSFKNHLIHSLS